MSHPLFAPHLFHYTITSNYSTHIEIDINKVFGKLSHCNFESDCYLIVGLNHAKKYFCIFCVKFLKMMQNFYLEYLLSGVPSGPIKNFSKFHAMSVLLTGFQMKNWGLDIKLSESSEGAGRNFFR